MSVYRCVLACHSSPSFFLAANRVARLARLAGIKVQIGYNRRFGKYGGKLSVVVNNTLDRQFNVDAPDRFWVTDITYIKTTSRYLLRNYLPGKGTMQSRQPADLALQALLMAVWRRKPAGKILIHSDQGSQFTSIDWVAFLKQHNLEHSPLSDALHRLPGNA